MDFSHKIFKLLTLKLFDLNIFVFCSSMFWTNFSLSKPVPACFLSFSLSLSLSLTLFICFPCRFSPLSSSNLFRNLSLSFFVLLFFKLSPFVLLLYSLFSFSSLSFHAQFLLIITLFLPISSPFFIPCLALPLFFLLFQSSINYLVPFIKVDLCSWSILFVETRTILFERVSTA